MKSETLAGRRWIGRILRDRWRIDARIARGGVGTVYAATHKNNGRRAAIKVLHAQFSRDADTRSRFLQEGYAANQVNHPGVVRILDDDTTEDGHAYLVMELLEGELLEARRVRNGGRLPLSDVYEVGEQLLDVLAAAHDKQIVHRDIKPDNLFITHEGRLKVLDFGFAQIRSQFRHEVTATGFLLGTPGFMSPEQAVGKRAQVDAQTDIWAVGATLFTLVSGEPVHSGQSAAEMLVAAANFPPRSLRAVSSHLPSALIDLVDRAVAFDKADRWPDARSMQLALRKLAGSQLAGAVSRPNIPAAAPVSELPTLHHDPMFVEELEATELADSAAWPAKAEPLAQSGQTLRPPLKPTSAHPADLDGPTTIAESPPSEHASDSDATQLAPLAPTQRKATLLALRPGAPPLPAIDRSVDPQHDGGTLIMESPVRDDGGRSGSHPRLIDPLAQSGGNPVGPPTPEHFRPSGQRVPTPAYVPAERPSARNLGATPATRAPAQGGNRAWVLVGVAVVSMVIVIVAGMLILAFTD